MVIQYKCPNCGTDMQFDSTTGTLRCKSCDHQEQIEGYRADYDSYETNSHTATYGDEEARQYHCKNCGATLVTDDHTAATVCSFCGSPMILGERISGDYAPSKVIPFTISKDEATKAFKKWCRKLPFAPRDFAQGSRVKEVVGMYVPFWLFNLRGQGEAHLHGTRSHTFTSGDEQVTETSHYDIYRQMDLTFDKLPADASQKMADDLMDALEPFDYNAIKDFNPSYLSGFLSEKYNFTDDDLLDRVRERAEKYMNEYIITTAKGYDTVTMEDHNYHIGKMSAEYTLLPVWMVYYDYENAEYIFAMNGQTGKIAGNPPKSWGKIAAATGLFTLGIFIIFRIITVLLGGPLL